MSENTLFVMKTRISVELDRFFGDVRKSQLWFRTPNPLLGNITPDAMIQAGRGEKLLKFVRVCIDENKRCPT